jgi:hypothetical protein
MIHHCIVELAAADNVLRQGPGFYTLIFRTVLTHAYFNALQLAEPKKSCIGNQPGSSIHTEK